MIDPINQSIYDLIRAELEHQDAKWGKDRVLDPRLWIAIIGEEFGEVCRANLEKDPDNYEAELVDVAASAISAIRSYRLKKAMESQPGNRGAL